MSRNSMSLKARIRNLARDKGVPVQTVFRNFIFERFLDRLSKSNYQDKFILKDRILITSLVGIDNRATMDLDITLINFPLNSCSISETIKNIFSQNIDDGFVFFLSSMEKIREDNEYGGYRIKIISRYDSIVTPVKIDITTGDVITPGAVKYYYDKIFDKNKISIWSYNIETVLAEKVETILSRGELSTRPRDYYDVYILTKTQKYNPNMFAKALKATSEHRKTAHIFNQIDNELEKISESKSLKSMWAKYKAEYSYAESITYESVCEALYELVQHLK